MLSLNNLALRRGTDLLFAGASFTIHQGRKVGFVGANGAGKTSLFKLILGELEIDEGSLEYPPETRIAHLEQEAQASSEIALEYVLAGDKELNQTLTAIQQVELTEDYGQIARLHEKLDSLDGYTAKSRAEQLMLGLGFLATDFERPLSAFSGGWRIRLNLAQALMTPSDLLLLDEPTNHLDLDAIVWLSNWIKAYRGSLLLISHDREFLDETVDSIAYLHHQTIELFSGNYSQFEVLKAARLAEQQSNYEKQQREVKHMQDFVRRFRAQATKARQAQSRLKALGRLELIAPAHIDSPFHFEIPIAEKFSAPLLSLVDADIGYSTAILTNIRLSLHPGDRLGLLGHNGAGKTTLVKTLQGELPTLRGERQEGMNLKIGYFSQHQVDDLILDETALQHIRRSDKALGEQQIRNYLGGFDFHGDKVLEPVRIFSGGEKARLALALVAFSRPNLLLMDEPTNHLDIDMRHALTVALQSFEGALLLISHDRHLLANTVDNFLLVEDGKITIFKGDLEDYRKRVLAPKETGRAASSEQPNKQSAPASNQSTGKQLRQLRTRIKTLDERLERLHTKLKETDDALTSTELYQQADDSNLQNLLREKLGLEEEIERLEEQWLDHHETLESMT
ncbi:ATP-binding cassette domain-containing protein [Pseudomonadales bacterium]|nr:ATP-binding cassette domain-containing protein [Pseudomonadales bacterium]